MVNRARITRGKTAFWGKKEKEYRSRRGLVGGGWGEEGSVRQAKTEKGVSSKKEQKEQDDGSGDAGTGGARPRSAGRREGERCREDIPRLGVEALFP